MDNRFFVFNAGNEGAWGFGTRVIVDRYTGVQYLYAALGYGGGLTVLVDAQGKPLLYQAPQQQ